MGACCSVGADVRDSAISPIATDTRLRNGQTMRVSLVPASHCYCLLIAPTASVFMDVRSKDAFDRSHLFGAWSTDAMLRGKTRNEAAIRSRCDLRWLVLLGSHEDPLEDEKVLEMLELLHDLRVRPISQRPLLVQGGVAEFERRFPFCMRPAGKEQLEPLPVCPAELVEPGQASRVKGAKVAKKRALYLGSLACLSKKNSEASKALKIAAAVRIVEDDTEGSAEPESHGPMLPGLSLCEVHVPPATPGSRPMDKVAESVASAALEACSRAMSMASPCLLCGPWNAVAAALYVSRLKPGWTCDELIAFVKDRCPGDWSHLAQEALQLGLVASQTPRAKAGSGALTAAEQQQQQLLQRLRQRPEEASRTLRTVRVALEKISAQPSEAKWRRLKSSNERVARELLAHPEAVALLERAGFAREESGDLVLPAAAPLEDLRQVLLALSTPDCGPAPNPV